MQYRNISADTRSLYRLAKNEEVIFFMFNRSGDITIELAGPGAKAHVFALYTANGGGKQSLRLTQSHLAPDTVSSALVKTALDGTASFQYDGAICIAKGGDRSNASQESRTLLLSREARSSARPALEILAHDVQCHHAATTSPLSEEAMFFALSRGLSRDSARGLLVRGFFQDALEQMEKLGIKNTELKAAIEKHLA